MGLASSSDRLAVARAAGVRGASSLEGARGRGTSALARRTEPRPTEGGSCQGSEKEEEAREVKAREAGRLRRVD